MEHPPTQKEESQAIDVLISNKERSFISVYTQINDLPDGYFTEEIVNHPALKDGVSTQKDKK